MILLDPDLDPDPPSRRQSTVRVAAAKRIRASERLPVSRTQRVPSARALARFLAEAQAAVRLRGQVTVLLTTDMAVRKLNREFRGIDKATDVLSFPAQSLPGFEVAGDLAISVPKAMRQAGEQGHALSVEVKVLMLHGLLHLAGYDHETDTGQMARRERLLRARLGLPQGLIERVTSEPAKKSGVAVRRSRRP
jgi:probable rRNA maturation factor